MMRVLGIRWRGAEVMAFWGMGLGFLGGCAALLFRQRWTRGARVDCSALAELCKTRAAQLADLKRQLEPVSTHRLGAP